MKGVLEATFPAVCVVGEIADFARPRSGHCYLTLKDDRAQLRAVLWRTTAARLKFDLHDGLSVVCRGHIDLYPPRGSYQLVIDQIEPQGIGALELAYRQLRDRLAKEGLFRPERKRPLPRFPRRIGVVSSPTGAAIHDFLQVLARRWQGTDIWIAPVRVQGPGAAEEVARAIALFNELPDPVDCLVVTRGGGSLEDLWTFNEELVVRAVYQSRIPVVSAIGHEIDVTLCDLAADVRALTPSEAAERVVPDGMEVSACLQQIQKRLASGLRNLAAAATARLVSLERHPVFRRPFEPIRQRERRLDELDGRLSCAIAHALRRAKQRLEAGVGRLHSLSPLAVLARGYSLTQREADGRVVFRAADLAVGDRLRTRLAAGEAVSRVEEIEAKGGQSNEDRYVSGP